MKTSFGLKSFYSIVCMLICNAFDGNNLKKFSSPNRVNYSVGWLQEWEPSSFANTRLFALMKDERFKVDFHCRVIFTCVRT